jgi:membrane-associated phospholipid phosphatase
VRSLISLSLCATISLGVAQSPAKFASSTGTLAYLGLGIGLPLVRDGDHGWDHALRAFDSVATTYLLVEGLKRLTRVRRPKGDAHDAFPSGHAALAFAMATAQSDFHPNESILWYGGAVAISQSRLSLEKHTVGEILAGAALGVGVAHWEQASPRGLLISPFVSRKGGFGLRLAGSF